MVFKYHVWLQVNLISYKLFCKQSHKNPNICAVQKADSTRQLEGLFYLDFAFQKAFKPHIAEQRPLIHLYSQLMQKKEFIQGDIKSVYLDALLSVMCQDFV